MMVKHKVQGKNKRSFREKQVWYFSFTIGGYCGFSRIVIMSNVILFISFSRNWQPHFWKKYIQT